MKVLITYKSRTGFTKKYAEMIAKEVDAELIDFKDVTSEKMGEYDVVVYGGRFHAGTIDGLKKARDLFTKSGAKTLAVFATGGTPNEEKEAIDKVWANNLSSDELKSVAHYYMQSGICYEKMNLSDKALMKFAATMLGKKKEKDDFEAGFEQAIASSYDISSEEFAKPMIEYLKSLS